ncbi:hypothetical protein L873DRAFT_1806070 [Choiromyces venosus 120613-1]|uniref:SCD domain-containing protein n=1 Tax=Choiromyces venosus 120613-1 TaxID=1336337 RepID=A0A3N4JSV1_9PEZI|nr:hypothetical protein L873DRAFT_1806070 [Choiromyces venosus 120613-1]
MDTSDDNAIVDNNDVGAAETADENASTTAGAAVTSAGNNDNTQNGAETGNRRRSTRVIKKPILPYSSQPTPPKPTRAKRKRPVEEDEEEQEEEQQEDAGEKGSGGENEEDEEGESDENGNDENEGDEEGSDAETSEESSEEDEDEGEPDEEEKKDRRRRNAAARGAGGRGGKGRATSAPVKRPPVKKPRTSATISAAPPAARKTTTDQAKRAKGKAVAKPPPKVTNGDDDDEEEEPESAHNDLYESVFEGDDDDDVAQAWTIKYEENSQEAMKELVNFILKCCGCHKFVTDYDIEDQDTANTTLSQIQEAFQRQKNTEYPLASKKPEFRRFRPILASFLHSLITTFAARELLYTDPGLMEGIEVWITAMSSSTLRQFRHTSTIVALEFVSCLAQIAAEARKANSTTNRQLEAEKKKSSRNEGRIKALDQKLKDGEERREAIETVIKDIFNIVFVHRYRDIDAKIRSDCVRELGSWILTLPDVFFDGSYLRYLGWVLSDTTPQTRLEVVKALTKLFKKKDSISNLRHFTERFRPRMVEMAARDADTNVRAAAADLLDAVREAGYLEPSDIDTVGRLLFDSEPKVRRAVVGFFVANLNDVLQERLGDLGGEEAVEEALGDDTEDENYEGPTLGWIRLKCLVEALASYDSQDAGDDPDGQSQVAERSNGAVTKLGDHIESRFSLAGGSLWEEVDEIHDWEIIARYLLYDHSANRLDPGAEEEDVEKRIKSAIALDPREEAILLHILNASVAASIDEGGELGARKKGTTKRTGKEIEKHYEAVSRRLTKYIPPLLKKFGPDPDAAASVLRLEQLMKLDVFQELRQSTAYASLLEEINRQFLTHADESVLKEASAAILHAKTFEELDEVTEQKLSQLKDETVTMLVNAVRGKNLGKGKFSDASLTELINTVRRLEYIASITNCVEIMEESPVASSGPKDRLEPVEALIELLRRSGTSDELEEELIIRTMKTLEFYFMWKISTLAEQEDIDADQLVTRGGTVMERIIAITKTRKNIDAMKITSGAALLGLATLFIGAGARLSANKPDRNGAANDDEADTPEASELATRISALGKKLDRSIQADLLKIFETLERSFANVALKALEPGENDDPVDDNDEQQPPSEDRSESNVLLHEQRLCDFTGKLVLAVLSRAIDERIFKKRLVRNKGRLGPNFREIVNHLEVGDKPKVAPVVRKLRGRKEELSEAVVGEEAGDEDVEATPRPKATSTSKPAIEGAEDEDEDENQDENEEEHDPGEPEEPEKEAESSDEESEPDPEAEVPPDGDGDEEMRDVDDE